MKPGIYLSTWAIFGLPTYMTQVCLADTSRGCAPQGGPAREIKSTHIWSVPLDSELVADVHTIKVETRDEYGQYHTGYKITEVLDDGLE